MLVHVTDLYLGREMWGSPRCAWVASGLIIFIVFVNVLSCPVSVLVLVFFFGGGGGGVS